MDVISISDRSSIDESTTGKPPDDPCPSNVKPFTISSESSLRCPVSVTQSPACQASQGPLTLASPSVDCTPPTYLKVKSWFDKCPQMEGHLNVNRTPDCGKKDGGSTQDGEVEGRNVEREEKRDYNTPLPKITSVFGPLNGALPFEREEVKSSILIRYDFKKDKSGGSDSVRTFTDQANISVNQANICANQASVNTKRININTNRTKITLDQDNINTNQTNIKTNQINVNTNRTNTNQTNISTTQTNLSTNQKLADFIKGQPASMNSGSSCSYNPCKIVEKATVTRRGIATSRLRNAQRIAQRKKERSLPSTESRNMNCEVIEISESSCSSSATSSPSLRVTPRFGGTVGDIGELSNIGIDNVGIDTVGTNNVGVNNIGDNIIRTNNISTNNVGTNNVRTNNIRTNNTGTINIDTNNTRTNNIGTNNTRTNNIGTNIMGNNNIRTNNIRTNNIRTNNIRTNNTGTNNTGTNNTGINNIGTNNIEVPNFGELSNFVMASTNSGLISPNALKTSCSNSGTASSNSSVTSNNSRVVSSSSDVPSCSLSANAAHFSANFSDNFDITSPSCGIRVCQEGEGNALAPLSPETRKKNEFCSYLQLMNLSSKSTMEFNVIRNRRSTRVQNQLLHTIRQEFQKQMSEENKMSKCVARKIEMVVNERLDEDLAGEINAGKDMEGVQNIKFEDEDVHVEKSAEKIAAGQSGVDGSKKSGGKDLESGKRGLDSDRRERETGRKELATNRKELDTGRKELDSRRKELDSGIKELDTGWKELATNRKELDTGRRELDTGRRELDIGSKELVTNKKELESGRKELEKSKLQGMIHNLIELKISKLSRLSEFSENNPSEKSFSQLKIKLDKLPDELIYDRDDYCDLFDQAEETKTEEWKAEEMKAKEMKVEEMKAKETKAESGTEFVSESHWLEKLGGQSDFDDAIAQYFEENDVDLTLTTRIVDPNEPRKSTGRARTKPSLNSSSKSDLKSSSKSDLKSSSKSDLQSRSKSDLKSSSKSDLNTDLKSDLSIELKSQLKSKLIAILTPKSSTSLSDSTDTELIESKMDPADFKKESSDKENMTDAHRTQQVLKKQSVNGALKRNGGTIDVERSSKVLRLEEDSPEEVSNEKINQIIFGEGVSPVNTTERVDNVRERYSMQNNKNSLEAKNSSLGSNRSSLGSKTTSLGLKMTSLGLKTTSLGAKMASLGSKNNSTGSKNSSVRSKKNSMGSNSMRSKSMRSNSMRSNSMGSKSMRSKNNSTGSKNNSTASKMNSTEPKNKQHPKVRLYISNKTNMQRLSSKYNIQRTNICNLPRRFRSSRTLRTRSLVRTAVKTPKGAVKRKVSKSSESSTLELVEPTSKIPRESPKMVKDSTKIPKDSTKVPNDSNKILKESVALSTNEDSISKRGTDSINPKSREPSTNRESSGNPIKREGNPIKREGNPIKREGNPTNREGYPIREGNPTKRQGNPINREGNQIKREGNPIKREGNPIKREGNPIREGNPTKTKGNLIKEGGNSTKKEPPSKSSKREPSTNRDLPLQEAANTLPKTSTFESLRNKPFEVRILGCSKPEEGKSDEGSPTDSSFLDNSGSLGLSPFLERLRRCEDFKNLAPEHFNALVESKTFLKNKNEGVNESGLLKLPGVPQATMTKVSERNFLVPMTDMAKMAGIAPESTVERINEGKNSRELSETVQVQVVDAVKAERGEVNRKEQKLQDPRHASKGARRKSEGVKQTSEEVKQKSEGVKRKSEEIKRKSEGVKQKSEGVKEKSVGLKQKFEGVKDKSEGVKQKFEGVKHKSEGVKEKSEGVKQKSELVTQKFEGVRRKSEGPKQNSAVKQTPEGAKQKSEGKLRKIPEESLENTDETRKKDIKKNQKRPKTGKRQEETRRDKSRREGSEEDEAEEDESEQEESRQRRQTEDRLEPKKSDVRRAPRKSDNHFDVRRTGNHRESRKVEERSERRKENSRLDAKQKEKTVETEKNEDPKSKGDIPDTKRGAVKANGDAFAAKEDKLKAKEENLEGKGEKSGGKLEAKGERIEAKGEKSQAKREKPEAKREKPEAKREKSEANKDKLEAKREKSEANKEKLEANKEKLEAKREKLEANKEKLEAKREKFEAKEETTEAKGKLRENGEKSKGKVDESETNEAEVNVVTVCDSSSYSEETEKMAQPDSNSPDYVNCRYESNSSNVLSANLNKGKECILRTFIQPEMINTDEITSTNSDFIPLTSNIEVKTLQRSLVQSKRKSTTGLDSDETSSQPWEPDTPYKIKEGRKPMSFSINISEANGKVINVSYVDFNLVIVQELAVSFWNQTALGNVLGAQNMWISNGSIPRMVLDHNSNQKKSLEVMASLDNSVAYIELWTKEHKSFNRERPVADVYAVVYFWSQKPSLLDKKVLQLENIKAFADDVQFIVLRNSRTIVVSWHVVEENDKTTIIHAYNLASDYRSVVSTKELASVNVYISSLHNIEDCDTIVMGSGEHSFTLWNVEYGYIIATIDLHELCPEPRTLWVKCDRGFLFTLQCIEDEVLRLIAINGNSHKWKRLQCYKASERHKKLKGVCIENGLIAAFYETGVSCWNVQSGECVLDELLTERIFVPSDKHILLMSEGEIHVRHALAYLLTLYDP